MPFNYRGKTKVQTKFTGGQVIADTWGRRGTGQQRIYGAPDSARLSDIDEVEKKLSFPLVGNRSALHCSGESIPDRPE